MTNPGRPDPVDELREIVQEMRELFAAAQEISNRPDWQNSYGSEFDRLVSKYFELNAIAHKHRR
jgi:hypothetical protein